jgi:hypothetical protein
VNSPAPARATHTRCLARSKLRAVQKGAKPERTIRLAYQPPDSSIFLSEQISHQQPANGTFLSEQISTSHQPNEYAESVYVLCTPGISGRPRQQSSCRPYTCTVALTVARVTYLRSARPAVHTASSELDKEGASEESKRLRPRKANPRVFSPEWSK